MLIATSVDVNNCFVCSSCRDQIGWNPFSRGNWQEKRNDHWIIKSPSIDRVKWHLDATSFRRISIRSLQSSRLDIVVDIMTIESIPDILHSWKNVVDEDDHTHRDSIDKSMIIPSENQLTMSTFFTKRKTFLANKRNDRGLIAIRIENLLVAWRRELKGSWRTAGKSTIEWNLDKDLFNVHKLHSKQELIIERPQTESEEKHKSVGQLDFVSIFQRDSGKGQELDEYGHE